MSKFSSNKKTETQTSVRNMFFKRKKGCPLSDVDNSLINYKNPELLKKYISENGRIMPSRISSISAVKQRLLKRAIKQARALGILPYSKY